VKSLNAGALADSGLCHAAFKNSVEILDVLANAGADINVKIEYLYLEISRSLTLSLSARRSMLRSQPGISPPQNFS